MIISIVSAAIGLFAMIAAALAGAGNLTLAAIYLISACPTLFLLFRAMLNAEATFENQGWPVGEGAPPFEGNYSKEINSGIQLTGRGYRSYSAMDGEN